MASVAILGATGAVGSALAQALVQRGRDLLLLGRNETRLSALSAELGQPAAPLDFVSTPQIEELLGQHQAECGGYSALVNCIGSVLLKPSHLTSDEEFRQVIEVNLLSAFSTVRAAAKFLREQGGAVVLFASAAARFGIPNHEAIAAAKAGVVGLARSAAATYAASNIRVNVISPGLVRSPMTRRLWENPVSAASSAELHPLGRLGEPRQVAALAAWLLEPDNDWITGQDIGLDGGLASLQPRRRASVG